MAFARVGTIGTAVQGAAGAGVSPGWGTGQNRTAGNLLILCVSVAQTATLPTTPSGWTIAAELATVRTGPLVPRPGISTGEGPTAGTSLSDGGHPPETAEGATAGTTIGDQGRFGGSGGDRGRMTVGVRDG